MIRDIMDDYEDPYDDNYDDDHDDDDDDDDSFDGYPDAHTDFSCPTSQDSSCQVITKESLLAAQREDLQRAMELLSLKEHHARTLLIHYRWDVDIVFAVLVEKGKERLYAEAGVIVQDEYSLSFSPCSSEFSCEICIEEVPANEMTTMDCGHCFCNNCWTGHFVVKINEGQSRRISCMAYKCHAICDEGKIRNLLSTWDPEMAEKFDRFLLESYIEDNKKVKWCPSVPHCGNAIRIDDDEYCEVECACGTQFCFNCSSEPHSPCSCLMWDLWTLKCKDESETINWMVVNTKQCPKCHKPVEKNGGCNLVVCVCGQAFCWLCGGPTGTRHTWENIEGHTCGRYKEGLMKDPEHARSELSRYIHYHSRFKAHTDSFKAEVKMKEDIKAKILKLEAEELELKDYSWVTNGIYRLFMSRRILAYSYPFAFYMFGNDLFNNEMTKDEKVIKQNLFEDQQQQLESNIEKLSMFLQEPFDEYSEEEIMKIRMKIINLSTLTDDLCKKLYECIDNDLLLPLQRASHIIAPYRSKGAEKAVELHDKDCY